MKKQSLALHFYKSVLQNSCKEFQSVQSHNSTEKMWRVWTRGQMFIIKTCQIFFSIKAYYVNQDEVDI